MVPNIANPGRSFHGALKYYAHDKRASKDEAHPTTSDRVAWQEVRNLTPGISAKAAGKIMAATAQDADNLKRAAGVSMRGRKADDRNVYSYSLSWEPSERPDKAEMLRAADETLKALGADDRQAVIICHTDREHSHVHVVLNMVSPIDGRKLDRDKDADKLSKWARDYERQTGRIVTPERHKKWEARERHPNPAERRAHIDKVKVEAQERANDRQSQAQRLRELGAAQRAQHKAQWQELAERTKPAREKIYSDFGARIKNAIERHKTESKPIWRQHFAVQRSDERLFRYRERTTGGRLRNAVEATRYQRDTGQLGHRGMLAATMRNFFSNEARWKVFNEAGELSRRELSGRLKSVLDREVNDLKAERKDTLERQNDRFGRERQELISRQDGEKAKLREAWAAIRPEADRAEAKPYRGRRNDFRAERIRAARQRQQDSRPQTPAARPAGDRRDPQPFDRKAAYAAVRKSPDAPMSTDDKKRAFAEAKEQVAAERQEQRGGLLDRMKNLASGSGQTRDDTQQDAAKKRLEQERQPPRPPRGPSRGL